MSDVKLILNFIIQDDISFHGHFCFVLFSLDFVYQDDNGLVRTERCQTAASYDSRRGICN